MFRMFVWIGLSSVLLLHGQNRDIKVGDWLEIVEHQLPRILPSKRQSLPIAVKTKCKFKSVSTPKLKVPALTNYHGHEVHIPRGFEVNGNLSGKCALNEALTLSSELNLSEKYLGNADVNPDLPGKLTNTLLCCLGVKWKKPTALWEIEGLLEQKAKSSSKIVNMRPQNLSNEGIAFDKFTINFKLAY